MGYDQYTSYAKSGVTSYYTIQDVEEIARDKIEESQRISIIFFFTMVIHMMDKYNGKIRCVALIVSFHYLAHYHISKYYNAHKI